MLQAIKNYYHLLQAFFANLYYGFPSRKLKVVGITGTDGKTTTTHLIYHILKSSGKKVSMISSVSAEIGGKIYDTGFHVTTPDVLPLHKFLRQSVEAGDEYFVLETTSHALAQNRTAFIKYEAGVITNITHEHLDFHKHFPNYVKSKTLLLQKAKIPLVNRDDKSYLLLKANLTKKIYTYGIKNNADFQLNISEKIQQKLAEFNNYNYLAAYSLCRLLNIAESKILNSLKSFKLPRGRLDVIQKKPFTVIIDFAHTPNAFHSVLSEVKEQYLLTGKRLIHVFGAAARRDSSKRPYMGEESGEYSDLVILTEEDYRDEDPQKIAREIKSGLIKKKFREVLPDQLDGQNKSLAIIIDRKKAIRKAIEIAKPGDVVIITGKSHEKSLCRGKIEYPWDEYEAVNQAIRQKIGR